jgi:hypothetical protein
MKVEPRHTFSIYLPSSLYQKLVDKAGKGKISSFVKQVLEEKLVKEEREKKANFQKELAEAYKRTAKSKAMKAEAKI